jgi:hypothetical protein
MVLLAELFSVREELDRLRTGLRQLLVEEDTSP